MKTEILKKLPWKKILKLGGITAVGVSAVMSANDTDENVQELLKKLAKKAVSKGQES